MKASLRQRLAAALSALRSERGNVAVVFALCAPIVVGGAALSAETSFDYYRKVRLQSAADAAAYTGALENRIGSSVATIEEAATAAAAANGWSAADGTIDVNTPPSSGAETSTRAVEVIVTRNVPRFFTALFTDVPIVARARSVAIYETNGNACVLALNRTASPGVEVTGSSRLILNGCDVMSNSSASDSVKVGGAGALEADCVSATGGISAGGGLTLKKCSAVTPQQPRVRDPFGHLALPTNYGAQQTLPNQGGFVQQGYYPGGMNFGNNKSYTLEPGVYVVGGSGVSTGAHTVVTSQGGVTFILLGSAGINMNSNGSMTLTAPSTGPYAGILFFADRSSTGGTFKFNGTPTSSFTGDLYLPTKRVEYNGNFAGAGGCMHLIADTVSWSGNADISVDCTNRGMAGIPSTQNVRLVQ
jgi:Flp pilus assembly protein TadG